MLRSICLGVRRSEWRYTRVESFPFMFLGCKSEKMTQIWLKYVNYGGIASTGELALAISNVLFIYTGWRCPLYWLEYFRPNLWSSSKTLYKTIGLVKHVQANTKDIFVQWKRTLLVSLQTWFMKTILDSISHVSIMSKLSVQPLHFKQQCVNDRQ